MFSGDELEFLAAMDRTGCILTDDGKFICDPEKSGLSFGSRVPLSIKGTYAPVENGWKITFRAVPAKKTIWIAVMFLATLLCCLMVGSWNSAGLFGILCAALAGNYVPQNKEMLKRFEGAFKK